MWIQFRWSLLRDFCKFARLSAAAFSLHFNIFFPASDQEFLWQSISFSFLFSPCNKIMSSNFNFQIVITAPKSRSTSFSMEISNIFKIRLLPNVFNYFIVNSKKYLCLTVWFVLPLVDKGFLLHDVLNCFSCFKTDTIPKYFKKNVLCATNHFVFTNLGL